MHPMQIGEVSNLSLLTPIREGFVPGAKGVSYRGRVELITTAAMRRLRNGGPSPLRNVTTLIFAQWTILDLGAGEQRRSWLHLTAAFNGDPVQYLLDLLDLVGPEMDQLYDNCEGYPGHRHRAAFLDYARRHTIETHLLYPSAALCHRTMRDLRRLADLSVDGPEHPRRMPPSERVGEVS